MIDREILGAPALFLWNSALVQVAVSAFAVWKEAVVQASQASGMNGCLQLHGGLGGKARLVAPDDEVD
jgi:hypothetical protein